MARSRMKLAACTGVPCPEPADRRRPRKVVSWGRAEMEIGLPIRIGSQSTSSRMWLEALTFRLRLGCSLRSLHCSRPL
jgi:hypothetical protein